MRSRILLFLAVVVISSSWLAGGAEPAAGAGRRPQYRGCNLVGGGAQGAWTEWAGADVATRNPGQGPQTPANYEFVTNADIDYLVSRGMNTFRLLFIHEAIQPEAFAAIPYAGGLPNASRYSAYY